MSITDKIKNVAGNTGGSTGNISFLKSIKGKLMLFFLLVGLIPALVIGLISYNSGANSIQDESYSKLDAVQKVKKGQIENYFVERQGDMGVLMETVATLQQEAFAKLEAIHDIKSTQIENYFGERMGDVSVLSGNQTVIDALNAFETAFEAEGNSIGGTQWNAVEAQYGSWFTQYEEEYGYYDLFLIHTDGDVIYSVEKESDLGANIVTGSLKTSSLGKSFNKAQSGVVFADFEPYAPSGGAPAAFVAAPVKDGGLTIGIVALQIPLDQINNIMQSRHGLGETGETYLVGPDLLMRSDSYLDPVNHNMETSLNGTVANNGVDTDAGRNSTAGQSGEEIIMDYNDNPVLSVYGPITVGDVTWGCITEIDVAEAFSPINEDGSEYFVKYTESYGYYDLFLITADGYVYYTAFKEGDLNTNMVNGLYSSSNLGELTREVIASKQFGFADFAPYEPSGGVPASFIAQPVVYHGEISSIVALQLPLDAINSIMQTRDGMGETGETYLVGPDKLMRSDSFLDPAGHSVAASFAGNVANNGVDTKASQEALTGNEGLEIITDYNGNPVLSAYMPLDVFGANWAIIAEMDESEVMESSNTLLTLFLTILAISIAAVIAAAFVIARQIANPLQKLVPIANAVAVGDVNQNIDVKSSDETGAVASAFGDMIDYMKEMAGAAEAISKGDLSNDVMPKSENDVLSNAFVEMTGSLRGMNAEMEMLAEGAIEGRLDTRGDATKFEGDYAKIVQGVNGTLDAVIGPLNVAAEYIDRISKGDIPEQITDEYKGDFNEIKNNINQCIDAINGLAAESAMLSDAAVDGKLDARGDASKFGGDFGKIVQGVNDTLDAVIGPLNMAAEYVDRIAKGDIPDQITDEYRGDFNEIKLNINQLIDALNSITDVAREIAGGNLKVNVEARSKQDKLMIALNNMVENLTTIVGDLTGMSTKVDNIAQTLLSSGEELNAKVSDMASSAEEIAAGAQAQSEHIDRITRDTDALMSSAENNQQNAESMEKLAQEAGEAVTEGNTSIETISESSEQMLTGTKATVETMNGLKQNVEQVQDIVEVLRDISVQTNILAINAAIEAVRAGKHGKGFALVAEQVQSLSAESKTQAKNIMTQVKSIQGSMEETMEKVTHMEQSVDTSKNAIDETVASFRNIDASVADTAKAVQSILSAAQEQKESAESVSTAMEEVTSVAQESANNAKDSAAATQDIQAMMEELNANSQTLADMAQQLTGIIEKFEVEITQSARSTYQNTDQWDAELSSELSGNGSKVIQTAS